MRFTIPGLMPDTPDRFAALRTVKLIGDGDAVRQEVILNENGAPADITGRVFKLVVTTADCEETGILDAVTITDAAEGELDVTFAENARSIIEVDDGMHAWVLAEEVAGKLKPIYHGYVYRVGLTGTR